MILKAQEKSTVNTSTSERCREAFLDMATSDFKMKAFMQSPQRREAVKALVEDQIEKNLGMELEDLLMVENDP